MKQIQQLFAEGKDSEASSLCNQLVGTSNGYGSYQSWGNIYSATRESRMRRRELCQGSGLEDRGFFR